MSSQFISIEEFCQTSSGGTPSRRRKEFYEGDIPWVKSGELRESEILDTEEHISSAGIENSSAKIVPKGAILLAMYGATVGRLATLGIDAATNQAVCSIVPDTKAAIPKYVYFALANKVPYFLAKAVGGAQPNISQRLVRETKIRLPDFKHQKQIVSLLDKADAIRRKRQQAIDLAGEFLRSVFLDMFGDPLLETENSRPANWSECRFVDFATLQRGYDLPVQSRVEGDTPIYAANGPVGTHNEKKVEGPGVVTGRSGTLGAVKFVSEGFWPLNTTLYVRDFHGNEPRYVEWFLRMFKLGRFSRGVGVPTLNRNLFHELGVFVPPIRKQKEFASICEKHDELLFRLDSASDVSNDLFNSLSQRAFNGDL